MMHRLRAVGLVLLVGVAAPARCEVAPDAHRGLYAIWATPEISDALPFIKGDQVRLQWSQVEAEEGHYDFSVLREQLERVAKLGRSTTVQLNANRHPDFLLRKVPYYKGVLKRGETDKFLQYWHPAYVKDYTALIAAFAREVKSSPHRDRIVGVRLNYNAIGTEFMIVKPEEIPSDQWVTPPGVTLGPEWKEEIASEYRRRIVDTYLQNFNPEIRVLLRSGIALYPDPDPETMKRIGTGNTGVFTTGSEIEPRAPMFEKRAQLLYLPYCRTGKAVCYAESMADATGKHGSLKDSRWCGPEQYNYWRLLSDLNLGIARIAIYGADLAHAAEPEYRAAFDFADRYAGYQASPSLAPGAWVALREGHLLKGDYTFLMRRLPGVEMKAEEKVGPDDQRFGAWARTLSGGTAKFALDADFARSLEGKKAAVRVIYLDRGASEFQVIAAGKKFEQKLTGSGRWKTAEFPIAGVSFQTGADGAQLLVTSAGDLTLHMIEVTR